MSTFIKISLVVSEKEKFTDVDVDDDDRRKVKTIFTSPKGLGELKSLDFWAWPIFEPL